MLSLSLGATNRSYIFITTIIVDLDSYFTTYILKSFTKSSEVRDHYEDVFGLIVHVLVCIRVSAMVLMTKLIVQFSLKSVKDPVWVIAPIEGSPDM